VSIDVRIKEIRRLEAVLSREDQGGRAEPLVDGAAARLSAQAERLSEVTRQLERRRLVLQRELHDVSLRASERARLHDELISVTRRAAAIDAKVEMLQRAHASRADEGAAGDAGESALVDAESRLRDALYEVVTALKESPDPRYDVSSYQQRLSDLVRSRRERLLRVLSRLVDARDYCVQMFDVLGEVARTARAEPGVVMATQGAGLPMADHRAEPVLLVTMAIEAFEDARRMMLALGVRWAELKPVSRMEDWRQIPLRACRELLEPSDVDRLSAEARTPEAFAARMDEALEMVKGIALWLGELASSVKAAPAPGIAQANG